MPIWLALLGTLLFPAADAQAALGEGVGTVTADAVYFSASVVPTTYGTYTTYVLTLPNGGTIDEYAAGGVVFALSWRTPGRPDLVQLLGSYFAAYQAENSSCVRGFRHAPPTVDDSNLVIVSRGHPGAFDGQALLPALSPAGFTSSDIK
jgi:hypothetical protein